MSKRQERGLGELYRDDPERVDALVFGRTADSNRRGFLKGAGIAAMGAAVGTAIPSSRNIPAGLVPEALAAVAKDFKISGKEGLTILNDQPVNAETPPHLLDDAITPIARHFIRNNGLVPDMAKSGDAAGWKITIDGEATTP